MPSSRASRCSLPSGSATRRMKPAAKAASTTSRSKNVATASRLTRSSIVTRTVVWAEVSAPRRTSCRRRESRRCSRLDHSVTSRANRPKAARTTSDRTGPRVPSSTAMATIGAQLTVGAVPQHVVADRTPEQPTVLEDRQQRPQRGRGEGDGYRDLGVEDVAADPEQSDEGEGQPQAHQPRHERPPASTAGELCRVDLEAGMQEEHGETELAEQPDRVVVLGQTCPEGTDHHPEHEQQHHLGDQATGNQPGDQGRDDGDQRDPEQRLNGHGDPPAVSLGISGPQGHVELGG